MSSFNPAISGLVMGVNPFQPRLRVYNQIARIEE
jgi:hypothetical protein